MIDKIRRNAHKLPLCLFYLGLTIEMAVVLIDRSALPPLPEGQIYRVTFLIFLLKVCFTKYTKKEWLLLVLFSVFTAGMYLVSGQNLALRAVFFVAAMRDIQIKAVMKYVFWFTLSGLLLIITLSFLGIGREIKLTTVYREVVETRYHFGIGHPNTFYCMILILILLFFYCYREKLRIWILVVFSIAAFGLFLLTDSRTGFLVTALAILGASLFYIFPKLKETKWIYNVGMLIFLFCIGISIWAAANSINAWDHPVIVQIDRLLSGRMKILYWDNAAHAGSLQTWKLFSTPDHFIYWHNFDMGWVRLFYWFGIIPGTIFTGLHLLLLNECKRKKDDMALLLIAIIAIYTIVEPQFISPYLGRNFLLFLFGLYWGQMMLADGGKDDYWWNALRIKKG